MQNVKLLCARCAAPLAPTLNGPRCPRMSACGFGGIVETLDLHRSLMMMASGPSEAHA